MSPISPLLESKFARILSASAFRQSSRPFSRSFGLFNVITPGNLNALTISDPSCERRRQYIERTLFSGLHGGSAAPLLPVAAAQALCGLQCPKARGVRLHHFVIHAARRNRADGDLCNPGGHGRGRKGAWLALAQSVEIKTEQFSLEPDAVKYMLAQ